MNNCVGTKENYCVYNSKCTATFHVCLTNKPIQMFKINLNRSTWPSGPFIDVPRVRIPATENTVSVKTKDCTKQRKDEDELFSSFQAISNQ